MQSLEIHGVSKVSFRSVCDFFGSRTSTVSDCAFDSDVNIGLRGLNFYVYLSGVHHS